MDFESPDVAKEFPGLYLGDLEVGMKSEVGDYDEDAEKSKKKKDKKKDKEKGYAALAGESSPDEDETKSPAKTKKLKGFILSGKKKDKEKDPPKPPEATPAPHFSSILRTGSIREKRPFDRERKPSEKELKKAALKEKEKEAKAQASCSTSNPRHSLPLTASAKISHPPTERTNSLTKNVTLNAFLNAPAPLLKKKDSSKEKEKAAKKEKEKSHSKEEIKKAKEHSSKESILKLKLKRGSKNSLEDSQSGDSSFPTSHQFPETPDAIAKEIRRYETLLEQSHAQIKGSKKVSKKTEEQLWELQRTLTQLKRKLRSVNALSSASSANVMLPTSSEKSNTIASEKTHNVIAPSSIVAVISNAPATSGTCPVPKNGKPMTPSAADAAPAPAAKPSEEIISAEVQQKQYETVVTVHEPSKHLGAGASETLKPAETKLPSLPMPDSVKRLSTHNMDTPSDSGGEEPNSTVRGYTSDDPNRSKESSKSPGVTSLEKFEVEVEVHSNEEEREILLTPEDVFDEEFESFDNKNIVEPVRNCPSPIIMGTHVGSAALSDLSYRDSGDEDNDSEKDSTRGQRSDVEFIDTRKVQSKLAVNQVDDRKSHEIGIPAFAVDVSEEFDPFSLPVFHSTEFVALENEALISFNQRLQDDIVREEERITSLADEYKYLVDAGYRNSALDDLESLDDDELAELWYSRKLENDSLHDKVNHLRALVVAGVLEEFRLETRLRYLQDRAPSNAMK